MNSHAARLIRDGSPIHIRLIIVMDVTPAAWTPGGPQHVDAPLPAGFNTFVTLDGASSTYHGWVSERSVPAHWGSVTIFSWQRRNLIGFSL